MKKYTREEQKNSYIKNLSQNIIINQAKILEKKTEQASAAQDNGLLSVQASKITPVNDGFIISNFKKNLHDMKWNLEQIKYYKKNLSDYQLSLDNDKCGLEECYYTLLEGKDVMCDLSMFMYNLSSMQYSKGRLEYYKDSKLKEMDKLLKRVKEVEKTMQAYEDNQGLTNKKQTADDKFFTSSFKKYFQDIKFNVNQIEYYYKLMAIDEGALNENDRKAIEYYQNLRKNVCIIDYLGLIAYNKSSREYNIEQIEYAKNGEQQEMEQLLKNLEEFSKLIEKYEEREKIKIPPQECWFSPPNIQQ
jgi:hypothetical protein